MSPRFDHIIWDWNGTLFDDVMLGIDIMNRMLQARGMRTMTLESYQEIFDFPVRDYYVRLGFDFEKESFEKLGTEFIDGYELRRNEATLQPDALAVLESFKQAGIQQSVLSAYKHNTLEHLLAASGVRHYFDHVIGSDDHYASGKIEQGRRFVAQLPQKPDRIVLIGDTVHDFEVSQAMGVHCLLVTSGYHGWNKLTRCGVPVLENLRSVSEHILGH